MSEREQLSKLLAEGTELSAKWKTGNASDAEKARLKAVVDEAEEMSKGVRFSNKLEAVGKSLGSADEVSHGLLVGEEFDRKTNPYAEFGFKAVTYAGEDFENVSPHRASAPGLGFDSRHLAPSLRFEVVEPGTTSVTSFRQTARTLADPTDMVRDIDAVTAKPATALEVDLLTAELKQIASVVKDVPNILLEQPNVADFVSTDLRNAYNDAIDYHIMSQLSAAGVSDDGSGGADVFEQILRAAEAVASNGYSGSLLVGSPEFFIELALATQPLAEEYVGDIRSEVLGGLRRIAVKGLEAAYVVDASAIGTLHATPVSFEVFEQNDGETNTSLARFESNAVFVVQRVGAIASVGEGSS